MWRTHDLAGIRQLSPADRRLLAEAMFWLGTARSATLAIPFRWTIRLFALRPGESAPPVDLLSLAAVQRIGWALRVSAARSLWQSTCLTQALAGICMLRRRRIPATLTMGVAKTAGEPGRFAAHAWLTCNEVILTGADSHERFNVIAKYTVVPPYRRPPA